MLEFDQHQVTATETAAEALALCESASFDLAILDYIMPEMRGDKLAFMLKVRFPELPIIMITADAAKVEQTDQRPVGVDLMMGKPFRLDDLREAVSKVLVKV